VVLKENAQKLFGLKKLSVLAPYFPYHVESIHFFKKNNFIRTRGSFFIKI